MDATLNNTAPSSLEAWQDKLHPLLLPVDPTIKTVSLQKLHAPNANANNIAAIISNDPALSLMLMHDANKSLSLTGNESHSLAHTLSLLGFPRVESLIRRAPEYDQHRFKHLPEFRQQLSISLHAAHQAQAWATFNPYWQQPVFWATLFHRAPLWALWYRAGDTMAALQQRRASRRGGHHPNAEQQLLGIPLQALAVALCRRWHLPGLTQLSWQSRQHGNARNWLALSRLNPANSHIELESQPKLQHLARQPALLVALANRMADESEWSWYSHRTLRLQKILASLLNQPLDDTITLSHRQAVAASRAYQIKQALSPARQLFSFYNKADSLKPLLNKDASKPAQPSASQPAKPARPEKPAAAHSTPSASPGIESLAPIDLPNPGKVVDDIDSFIRQLLQQPSVFNELPSLINRFLQGLNQHCQLQRTTASLIRPGSNQLCTFYSHGTESSPALSDFRHHLQRNDLFHKLLQRPLSMRLQASNYAKVWPLLPDNFKQACAGNEFFMMSVFAHQKPLVLIYGDQGLSQQPLNEEQYTRFKQLCRALGQAIEALA